MDTQFKETGYWWFISAPNERFHGTLTFDPNKGGNLTLTVSEEIAKLFWGKNELEIIHGETVTGCKISLFNCYLEQSSASTSGLGILKIIVNRIFNGFHLPSMTEDNIRSCTLSFNSLNEWLANPGIEVNYIKATREFDIFLRKPPKIEIPINDDLFMVIETHPSVDNPSCFHGDIRINSYSMIRIITSKPKSCKYYFNLIGILQDFFTIACLTFSIPENIQFEGDFDIQLVRNNEIHPHAQVLYVPSNGEQAKSPDHPNEMLFQLKDVNDELLKIFSNWIQKASLIKPVRSLYCTGLYSSRPYLESTFLNLVQAIEVFHRRLRDGTYMKPSIYEKELLPKIRDSIPPDLPFRKSMLQRLEYLNEFSLSKRLKTLFKENDAILKLFILSDIKQISQEISNYRNYLTHFTKKADKDLLEARKLEEYSNTLRLILELSFLREMGFAEDKIYELVKRNEVYRYLIFPK